MTAYGWQALPMAPEHITRDGLAALESHRLIVSRPDVSTTPPQRIYFVTAESRRATGISDTRSAANP